MSIVREAMYEPMNPAGRVLMGAWTIAWGIWFASPFWDVYDTSIVYEHMMKSAPEYVWGLAGILIGLYVFVSSLKDSKVHVYWSTFLMFYFWLIIDVFMWSSNFRATQPLMIFFICLYCAWIHLNIKYEHRIKPKLEKVK